MLFINQQEETSHGTKKIIKQEFKEAHFKEATKLHTLYITQYKTSSRQIVMLFD